jgi:hypothetical protein
MNRKLKCSPLLCFGLTWVMMSWAGLAMAAQDYRDVPISLEAKTILPEGWRQGDHFQVGAEVQNDGLFNRYTLQTDYGRETVISNAALLIRIQELKALGTMGEMDRKKVFGDSLVAAAKAPFKGAAALVKSPVETSKGIAKGTGRFFSNLGHSLFSGDPDQDNALKVALGYDAVKRKFAYEFGIDPYTDYKPVINRLGQIARAAVAGGITPRAALSAISSPVATGISLTASAEGMRQLVRDNPPGELRKINSEKLERMGVDDLLADAFLDNYSFNPQEETLLVGALEAMPKAKGRDVMVLKASLARDKTMARYERLRAQMMSAYYAKVHAEVQVVNAGGAVGLRRKDATLVLLAPVDFIFWTKGVADKLATLNRDIDQAGGFSGKELWITGNIDDGAMKHFEAAGWKVNEDAQAAFLEKEGSIR